MCTSVSEFLLNCFCFKQKTAYEMRISDWSSDVCSSDLQSRNRSARPDRERNPERRHVERLPGEGSGTRRRPATYIMHNRLIQKLASDIASSSSEDQLYVAFSITASRLGFDHFSLSSSDYRRVGLFFVSSFCSLFSPFLLIKYFFF